MTLWEINVEQPCRITPFRGFGPADVLAQTAHVTLRKRLAPFADPVVWWFGGYYALEFGATVALTQWLVPYGINVHGLTLQQAGFLATLIALPSGLVKPLGAGWRIGLGRGR